jgi:MFS family permease
MMTLSMALVSDTVSPARGGRAMGLLGSMSAVGTALGPSLGGLLVAGLSWRAIFFINLPLGITAYFLASRHLTSEPHRRPAERHGFDVPGTLLLALSLGAYALAMTSGRGRFGAANAALLFGALCTAALFILTERRAASPLLRLELFRNPSLSAGLAMSALISTVTMATMVVGPFYLSRGLGLGAAAVGLIVSIGPLVAAATGLPAGRLTDRYGPERMTAAGLVVTAGGAVLLATVAARLGLYGYIPAVIVVTTGYALFQAANSSGVMAGVGADRRGVVAGMLNLARNLGLITGASAMGALFSAASGSADLAAASPERFARAMQVTFAVATILTVLAISVGASCGALTKHREPEAPARPQDRVCGAAR